MTKITVLERMPAPTASNEGADDAHVSEHTVSLKKVAERRGHIRHKDGEALYAGRRIVDRDSFPIEGMVDIRSSGVGEAIVVDSERGDSESYALLEESLFSGLPEGYEGLVGQEQDRVVLEAINSAIRKHMKYDLAAVNLFSDNLRKRQGEESHAKVNLDVYMGTEEEPAAAVCRHMALGASWLAEQAQKKGLLKGGRMTVPVNQRAKDNAAHEWARYTPPTGEVSIVDPAKDFVGTLEESVEEKDKGDDRWEYCTDPGEKEHIRGRIAGRGAMQEYQPDPAQEQWWHGEEAEKQEVGRFTYDSGKSSTQGWEPARAIFDANSGDYRIMLFEQTDDITDNVRRKTVNFADLLHMQPTQELKDQLKRTVGELLGVEEATDENSVVGQQAKIEYQDSNISVDGSLGKDEQKPEIIDTVPKTKKDLERLKQTSEQEFTRLKTQAMHEVHQSFDTFKEGLDNGQDMLLWRFASAKMNKREAERDGNYSAAGGYTREAFEVEQELSKAGLLGKSSSYILHMQYLEAITRSNNEHQLLQVLDQFRGN